MNEVVRLRFSGLVVFSSQILSVLTGLIFTLTITRQLSTIEFGAWTIILSLVGSAGILSGVFSFWSGRFAARKYQGALKLGLLANLCIAAPLSLIAAVLAYFFVAGSNTQPVDFLYVGLFVIQYYVITALTAVVVTRRPQVSGYAFVTYEVVKVIIGVLLVFVLRFGLFGALTALIIANTAQITELALTLSRDWLEKIHYEYLVQWIKGSPLNFYGSGASFVTTLPIYILIPKAGVGGIALYGAALALATPISYTASLSAALYPKLLAGGDERDVETVWRISLLFSVPLTLAVLTLAPSLLAILKSSYVPAYLATATLALSSFIGTFANLFDQIITGTERLDAKGTIGVREAFRSRIVKSSTFNYIIYTSTLPVLWLFLELYGTVGTTAVEITAAMILVSSSGIAIARYCLARNCLRIHFPARSALKFFLVAVALASVTPFLEQPMRALVTIPLFFIGAGAYFLILYFIEDEAKMIIRAIASQIASSTKSIFGLA